MARSFSSKVIRDDFAGLNNLAKALSSDLVVKVGIMGSKAGPHYEPKYGSKAGKGGTRPKSKAVSNLTNAALGAVMEFGSVSRGIPARSFLRMPITREAKKIMAEAGADPAGARQMAQDGTKKLLLTRLGIACENAVQRAFGSRGFGLWAPDDAETIRRKGSSMPLIDTGQLRRSIASKVDKPAQGVGI